jgi:hypothetical protein
MSVPTSEMAIEPRQPDRLEKNRNTDCAATRGAQPETRADGRTRTGDILFTREVLYQLSYVGALCS